MWQVIVNGQTFNTIKAQDAKRGKLFTKLIREIVVATKEVANKDSNPRLRLLSIKHTKAT